MAKNLIQKRINDRSVSISTKKVCGWRGFGYKLVCSSMATSGGHVLKEQGNVYGGKRLHLADSGANDRQLTQVFCQ